MTNFTPSNKGVFYKVNTFFDDNNNIISCQHIRGLESNEDPKILFRHISINTFENIPTEIPDNAILDEKPSESWIREYFLNLDMFLIEHPENRPCGTEGFTWYRIEDNGNMSFVVYIHPNTNETYVFKFPDNGYINNINSDDSYMINYYTECIFHFKSPVKTWIGIDYNEKCHGNSILIQVSSKTYIYVGSVISIFVSKDPIIAYYSNMCKNKVPYPIALTETDVFLMLHSIKIPRSEIEGKISQNKKTKDKYWDEAYNIFYENESIIKKMPFDTLEKQIRIANGNALWSRIIRSFKERYYDPCKGNFIKIASKRFKKY